MNKNTRTEKKEHRVFIVDDHPIVRSGLKQLINQESGLSVCGDAGDIPQALKAIKKTSPDLTIIDISLGHSCGIRLIEDLSHYYPDVSTLAYSMHDELIYAERCLRAGAKGYVMKQEPPEKLLLSLRKILDGDIYISDKMGTKLLSKFVTRKDDSSFYPVDLLSNRELEVFQLVGQGLKIRKIAEELTLSIKTIETYTHNIRKKMNFTNLRELFLHAIKFVN